MKCSQQRNAGKQICSYTSGAPADSGLEQQGEQEAAPEAQGEGAGLGGGVAGRMQGRSCLLGGRSRMSLCMEIACPGTRTQLV